MHGHRCANLFQNVASDIHHKILITSLLLRITSLTLDLESNYNVKILEVKFDISWCSYIYEKSLQQKMCYM